MKYLVASDIHGSVYYTEVLKSLIISEECDKVILLGDLFSFSKDNIELLNSISNICESTIGNCDSSFHMDKTDIPFKDYIMETINDKVFFFTHGHLYSYNTLPRGIDVYIQGHTHVYALEEINDLILANPGSITNPRNNTPNSYMTIDDEYIKVKDIDGHILTLKKYK